ADDQAFHAVLLHEDDAAGGAGAGERESLLAAFPVSQRLKDGDALEVGHRLALVVAGAGRDLRIAWTEANQQHPRLFGLLRQGAGYDHAAVREPDGRRIGADIANGEFRLDALDAGARAVQAAGIDDLRRIGSAIFEDAVVALLPLAEFGFGEGVVPAEIIPVADRIGERDDVRALGQYGDVLVRRRAVAAAL